MGIFTIFSGNSHKYFLATLQKMKINNGKSALGRIHDLVWAWKFMPGSFLKSRVVSGKLDNLVGFPIAEAWSKSFCWDPF